MWNCISLLAGSVGLFAGRTQYLKQYVGMPANLRSQTFPLIYITDMAAIISTLFFVLGLIICINDHFESKYNYRSKFLKKWKIFYRKTLPFILILNTTVSVGYWGLYFYNPGLLAPKILNKALSTPLWKNVIDHTIGLIVTIIEIIVYNFHLTSYTFILTGGATVLYYTDILIYNHFYNIWPYGFMTSVSKPMIFLYCFGFLLTGTLAALFILV
ncbi:hypothetical protein M153_26910001320, partial [Pseudoloma neurophilia]